ncbi:MAG TPA: DNA gyrase subunit A, partial [Firmicutes bacterium]|nr:DNA gyrase subunit A [Bacillota bacterium]
MRYPLIDGQGNFGSIDGDPPAAMRYTEARLQKITMEMLSELEKDTVEFRSNYDETRQEPTVFPSRFPNLLVNGSSGIAVGMATNMPPHNIGEVCEAIIALIDNPDLQPLDLLQYIKGPDFPTGGFILGTEGIKDYFETGRGRIIMRGEAEIDTLPNDSEQIIIRSIPYQLSTTQLIDRMVELVKDKRIEGISDIRDESGRDGMRLVIQVKRNHDAQVVRNLLYKHTQLQATFGVINLCLIDGVPQIVNMKEMLQNFIEFRHDVILRRTLFDLRNAKDRLHILEGLKIALDNLDEVISIIRSSRTEALAKERLVERFSLSEKQAQAIVDMRLGRLTGLEREKIEEELRELMDKIAYYKEVLSKPELVHQIIKDELTEIKNKFGDERRTKITIDENEIDMEDLIKDEDVVVTLTRFGYIKRTPIDAYRSQKRGGKGIVGLTTREDDFVADMFTTSTHRYLMFFSNKGKVYKLRAWQIPEAGRQARGTAVVNLLQLDSGEKITAAIKLHGDEQNMYLIMATKKGMVKKTPLEQYDNIRKGGIAAINLREDDELISTRLTDGTYDIILVTKNGMSIRFNEKDARPMGRTSIGVIGIRLDEDDEVISMVPYFENTTLLVVTVNGFGKRTDLDEYKVQTRGGKGVLTYRVTEKTGYLIGAMSVDEDDDLMLISTDGTIIRMHVNEISILSRVTQGVTLMRTSEDNRVASLARISADVKENEEEEEEAEAEAQEEQEESIIPDITPEEDNE